LRGEEVSVLVADGRHVDGVGPGRGPLLERSGLWHSEEEHATTTRMSAAGYLITGTVVCGPKVLQRALAIFRALFQQGVGIPHCGPKSTASAPKRWRIAFRPVCARSGQAFRARTVSSFVGKRERQLLLHDRIRFEI